MKAEKDRKTGKWLIQYRYTDWQGNRKKSTKRGFATKREAEEWARQFLLSQSCDFNMKFESFIELYFKDCESRLKKNTIINKRYIINLKITPVFGKKKMNEITSANVREWQNELLKQGYAQTYLKTIHNQLSTIFNHAVRLYGLKENPCHKAGSIGKAKAQEMLFYTNDEFNRFIEKVMDKRLSYICFMVLYWTGMRIGDDDDKIRLNQRKPSKYKGLSRFGPEKNLQRINKFMKERPTFYKKLIQMKENFRFYLRCFYCITKVVILQFNSEKQDRISS